MSKQKLETKLKTTLVQEKSGSRPSGLGRIFQNVQNALVPVSRRDDSSQSSTRSTGQQKTLGVTTPEKFIAKQKLGSATVVTTIPSPQEAVTKIEHTRTAIQAAQPPQKKKTESSSAGWLLLVPAVGLATFALMDTPDVTSVVGMPASTKVTAESAEFRERADFHRKMTGWKLNRERVDVDLENRFTAPSLEGAGKVAPPDLMKGLPLQAEAHHRKSSRDRSEPVNPGYADARVMYGLQEEQDAAEWAKRADELYMKEFVENARRGGYEVKFEKDGTVTGVPIPRAPGSEGEYSEGGAR